MRGASSRVSRRPPDWLFQVGLVSDVGRSRERNEDAVAVFLPYAGETHEAPVDALFVVADGMGGHELGHLASRLAVDRVRGRLTASVGPGAPTPDPAAELRAAFDEVHGQLEGLARERGLSLGAGTTATAAVARGGFLTIAHVGDTRLYRLRAGALDLLTEDHSWVAEQRRAGVLTEQAAASHTKRNVLTRCLGLGADAGAVIRTAELRAGDRYLLSSDGLHGALDADRVAGVLANEADPQAAARILVALANEVDGSDNITAVVFHVAAHPARILTDPGSPAADVDRLRAEAPGTGVADGEAASRSGPPDRLGAARRGARLLVAAGATLFVLGAGVGTWVFLDGDAPGPGYDADLTSPEPEAVESGDSAAPAPGGAEAASPPPPPGEADDAEADAAPDDAPPPAPSTAILSTGAAS